MRRKGISKEETRQQVSTAVSQGFRKHGYAGIGVESLAKAAGVTTGAFYAHLGSKAKAFDLALEEGLQEVIVGIPYFQAEHKDKWAEHFLDYYLGESHCADLENGCAMAALTAEVARFPAATKTAYQTKMQKIAALIARGISIGDEQEKLDRAWAFISIITGALNVMRALKSAKTARLVASAARSSALQLIAGPVN